MKCVYCGSEVAEGAKFCTECGKPLAASIADDGVSAGDATQNSLENSGMETQLAESVQDEPQPEKKEEKEKEGGCGCGCVVTVLVIAIILSAVIMLIPDSWLNKDEGTQAGDSTQVESEYAAENEAESTPQVDEAARLSEAMDSADRMIDSIDLLLDNFSSFVPEKKREALKKGRSELKAVCKGGDVDKIEKKVDEVIDLYDSVYSTYVTDEIDSAARAQISLYGEDTVKRFLTHPSSAKFGWAFDVERLGKWYAYSGDVTAVNSFGVEDKYAVYVEFKESNKKIKPMYVNIGGKVFYGSKPRLKG